MSKLDIGYFPQIPLSAGRKSAKGTPDYTAVFIGGFGDFIAGNTYRLFEGFEGFLQEASFLKAYYHWDGCSLGLLRDNWLSVARDIGAHREAFPETPLVLIGHSYGGSAAMEIARYLSGRRKVRHEPIVLTVDAVSRRQAKTRAQGIAFWGNSYLSEGGGILDVVPRFGGRWGAVYDADVNLPFSGYSGVLEGEFFAHRDPAPMLMESPDEGQTPSLKELAAKVLFDQISSRRD